MQRRPIPVLRNDDVKAECPFTATQVNPMVAARISPVGVSPANAIHQARLKKLDRVLLSADRSVITVVATHGRQP